MAPKLSASSIRDYMNTVKGVVASAINENGEEVFPRKWNDEYIDAPVIDSQNQPSTNGDSMTAILAEAKRRYQMLFALLAECGPLRAGEALSASKSGSISLRTSVHSPFAKWRRPGKSNSTSRRRTASAKWTFAWIWRKC
jgi:hypothetical protein